MIPISFSGNMFKGQGLNHSFEPSVLSTLYILIPWLLASNRFCFYKEVKPEFCTMGGIYVSETFLVINETSIIVVFTTISYTNISFYGILDVNNTCIMQKKIHVIWKILRGYISRQLNIRFKETFEYFPISIFLSELAMLDYSNKGNFATFGQLSTYWKENKL